MKVTNTYPVEAMIGTDSSSPRRTYYLHQGQQVSRRYNPPAAPYNANFNYGRIANDSILKAYKALAPADSLAWATFCNDWNGYFQKGLKWFNTWTAFCTVNFYQVMRGLDILTTPPIARPPKVLDACAAIAGAYLPTGGRFDFNTSNFPTVGAACVFWITKPYQNFQHAFRKSEIRLASGFSSLSVATMPDTVTPQQFEVETISYPIAAGDYLYIDSRLITDDGFPMPVRRFPAQVQEAGMLTSIGAMWHQLFTAGLFGGQFNQACAWVCDQFKLRLFTDQTAEPLRIPLVFGPGTTLDSLEILWLGSSPGNTQLSVSLEYNEFGAGAAAWQSLASSNFTCPNPEPDPVLQSFTFTPITIEEDLVYSIKVNLVTAANTAILYGVGVRSQKRIF